MKIGETFYAKNRRAWRAWLNKHHAVKAEVWLIYYKKHTGQPRVAYIDAVEEALCFGWIDSTVKTIDDARYAQRFGPRKNQTNWSEPNKERVRRLIEQGHMKPAGLAKATFLNDAKANKKMTLSEMPRDIIKALKADATTWKYFQAFPALYQHMRVAWIEAARHRPELFQQRLRHFIKMTAQNKRYGMPR